MEGAYGIVGTQHTLSLPHPTRPRLNPHFFLFLLLPPAPARSTTPGPFWGLGWSWHLPPTAGGHCDLGGTTIKMIFLVPRALEVQIFLLLLTPA